MSDFSSEGSF